jgi:hypothetical protein
MTQIVRCVIPNSSANRRWRWQFRCRGSRRESAVAQLSSLGGLTVMSNLFTSFESRLKIYRRVWMVAVVLTVILRFTFFLHAPEQSRFYVFLAFLLGTWLPLMIGNLVESQRFRSYFATHHGSPRDFFLGFRMFACFFSRDDHGDPNLEIFRQERHRFGRFMFTVFFTYPVIFFIFAV